MAQTQGTEGLVPGLLHRFGKLWATSIVRATTLFDFKSQTLTGKAKMVAISQPLQRRDSWSETVSLLIFLFFHKHKMVK